MALILHFPAVDVSWVYWAIFILSDYVYVYMNCRKSAVPFKAMPNIFPGNRYSSHGLHRLYSAKISSQFVRMDGSLEILPSYPLIAYTIEQIGIKMAISDENVFNILHILEC